MIMFTSTLAFVYLSSSYYISLLGITLYIQTFSNSQPNLLNSSFITSL